MTSEETSVHKLAYAISIQDGGEQRRILAAKERNPVWLPVRNRDKTSE